MIGLRSIVDIKSNIDLVSASPNYLVYAPNKLCRSTLDMLVLGAKLIAGAISSCAFIGVAVGVGLIFSSLV